MSLGIILLCGRNQTAPRKYILYDFLYIKRENANQSQWVKQVSDCLGVSGVREGHKGTYGDDECIHHHDYRDGFMGAYMCQNLLDCAI